jgi:hypothetical protein
VIEDLVDITDTQGSTTIAALDARRLEFALQLMTQGCLSASHTDEVGCFAQEAGFVTALAVLIDAGWVLS